MGDIAGLYKSNQSYNPKIDYNVSYSETGRSGSSVSYSFTVSYNRLNGSYAYDIQVNWNIGGVTGSQQLKSTADTVSGSTTFNVTCSTDANGGTLSARIYSSSNNDSTHYQNGFDTGSQTVNKSTFNTAPTTPGTVSADGSTTDKKIPENQGSIAVTWGASSDANGNLSSYRIQCSINGGGYTELGRATTTSFTHNVTGYGEGTTFKYAIDATDSYNAWSGTAYSPVITKNVLTNGSITSMSNNIVFDTTSFTVTFATGSNSNGSNVYNMVYSDNVTVYNATEITKTTTQAITIYKTGTVPTGPYIKFDDLKNYFKNSNYNGNLHIGLRTRNDYGTTRWYGSSIAVDLRTNPNAVTAYSISTVNTESTMYKQIGATSNWYFIPDGSLVARVKWTDGSGKLGETVSYEVYVAYGSGGWTKVADVASGVGYYNHVIPTQTISQSFKYLVRTKTSYGYYSDATTAAQTLHYYNKPTITISNITRTATTCDVIVTVLTISSIPNINTTGSWNRYAPGTTTPSQQTGTLTVAQTAQTIALTSLTDAGTYDLAIVYNDNTGFSTNQTKTISIGQNSPVAFVNKYGLGIGGVKATATHALKVSGDSFFEGVIGQNGGSVTNFDTILTEGEYHVGSATSLTSAPFTGAIYGKLIVKVNDGGSHDNTSNWIWQHFKNSNGGYWNRNKTNAGAWSSWEREYSTSYKPTATDVGLGNVNNWGASSAIGANSTTQYATTNMVALVRAEKLSLSGGTMTGDLNFTKAKLTDSGAGGSLRIVGIGDTVNGLYLGNSTRIYAMTGEAKLYVEGKIYCNDEVFGANIVTSGYISTGKYSGSNANITGNRARIIQGATDTEGSIKIQVGGSDSCSFEVVNPAWSTAWFTCNSSGIKAASYSNFSDETIKTNISVAQDVSSKVENINVYNYNYNNDFDTNKLTKDVSLLDSVPEVRWGVLAQEVELIFPELISTSDTLMDGEVKPIKTVDLYGLVSVIFKYAKELDTRLQKLENINVGG